jgi:tetratricopeptide (TPR) repeat protein
LKKASDLQPDNPDFFFMLGEAYTGLRKFPLAAEAYSMATELNPLDFEAWLACAQVRFKQKQFDRAIHTLLRSLQFSDSISTIYYRIAAYFTYAGDINQALSFFRKGLNLSFKEHKSILNRFPKMKQYHEFRQMIFLFGGYEIS